MYFYTKFKPATPVFWNEEQRFDFFYPHFYPQHPAVSAAHLLGIGVGRVDEDTEAEEEVSRMDAIEARLEAIEIDIYDEDDEDESDEEEAKEDE